MALWFLLNRTAPDTTPDAFSFTDQTDVAVSTLTESSTVTVAGINTATTISVSGGEYQVNGGSWTSSSGTVVNGDTVKVRHTSSASNTTATNTTLTIGGVSDTFTTTTVSGGSGVTGPDAMSFFEKASVSRSTQYQSNPWMITGLSGSASISISGSSFQYRINSGSWTSSSGTAGNGDIVEVRGTSSASFTTANSGTLNVNGVTAVFTLTTHGEERGTTGRSVTLSSASSTATLTSGSTSVTFADATNFSNGDVVIFPVGYETATDTFDGQAAAGRRGTMGVGGTWPAKMYADQTARDADGSPPATNTYIWLKSTGMVQRKAASGWTADPFPSNEYYYTRMAIPRALVVTLSGKSGNTFTMSTAASATTSSSCPVYKDNAATFEAAITSGGTSIDLQPNAGTFAFSRRVSIASKTSTWSITGHASGTTFFAPDGARQMQIDFFQCTSPAVWDLTIQSNNGDNGFGFWFPENAGSPQSWEFTETNVPQGLTTRPGLGFQNCTNARVRRVTTVDTWAAVTAYGGGTGNAFYDCSHSTPGNRQYLGWQYQHADGSGPTIMRCNITSTYLVGGMEFFQCSGVGTMVDCNHVNATFAFNSTGECYVTRCGYSVTSNSQRDSLSYSSSTGGVSVNGNINPSFADMDEPKVFTDFNITATATVNGTGEILEGFQISNHNTDVTITGTQRVAGTTYASSHLAMGTWTAGYVQGGIAVNTEATGTEISYIRISGTSNAPTYGNVQGNNSDTYVHHCMVNLLKYVTTQSNNEANP